ncbi:MAG: hypothetical protein AVDCRST_MAG04-2550, partial [uncultured Acetobacteraceae bacterium]
EFWIARRARFGGEGGHRRGPAEACGARDPRRAPRRRAPGVGGQLRPHEHGVLLGRVRHGDRCAVAQARVGRPLQGTGAGHLRRRNLGELRPRGAGGDAARLRERGAGLRRQAPARAAPDAPRRRGLARRRERGALPLRGPVGAARGGLAARGGGALRGRGDGACAAPLGARAAGPL